VKRKERRVLGELGLVGGFALPIANLYFVKCFDPFTYAE
jgi:hypothetical protein